MVPRKTEDAGYRLRIVGSESRVETAEEFDYSYFREEYKSILRAVWRVIESTRLDRERRDTNEYYKRYNPDIRIHNIVPIIGSRGSGKSSILLSVAGLLQDGVKMDDRSDSWLWEYFGKNGKFQGIRFFETESIDGSLLEHHEGIFPTILVQMKGMLPPLSAGSDYKLRELHKELEKLYESARQMEDNACDSFRWYDRWEEMTPLSSMKQLSSSLSLRRDFRELLRGFLDYLNALAPYAASSCERTCPKDSYLMILIDDLDLNILHGYEMLEKLHRYLMLPNVIVLLAFDQEQFIRLCEKEFYKMIPTFDSRMNEAAGEIEELARQYLEKVMPLTQRTYVPSLDNRSEVIVSVKSDVDSPSNFSRKSVDSNGGLLPKPLVFRLLFEKLGMRMDTDGGKRHFFELRPLRNYVNLVNLLNRMDSPFWNKSGKASFREDVYRHNHQVFLQEITQGMAMAWLSERPQISNYRVDTATTANTYTHRTISPKEQFDQITEVSNPVPRAFRNFFFSVRREGKEGRVGSSLYNLSDSLDYYRYSYGEILYIIYHYGRISNDNKTLIHSLMAYYSLVLNQCYLGLRQQKRNKSDDTSYGRDCRKDFLQLMNGSVAGNWANSMVPAVWLNDRYYGSGCRVVNDMGRAFSVEDVSSLFEGSVLEGKEKIQVFFRAVLMIGMLFDRPSYKLSELFTVNSVESKQNSESTNSSDFSKMKETLGSVRGSKKDSVSVATEPNAKTTFQPIKGKGTFGFLNFASTACQYNSYLWKLLDYTGAYVENNAKLFGVQEAQNLVTTWIEETRESINREFQKWDEHYFGFALPVYDIDVCYNLMKRQLQVRYGQPDCIGNGDSTIPTANAPTLFDSYLEIYQSIANQLHSNDKAYEEDCGVSLGDDSPRPLYAKAFCECPFIKWLDIQPEKKNQPEESSYTKELTKLLLNKVFENLLSKTVDNRMCSDSSEDKSVLTRTASYDD